MLLSCYAASALARLRHQANSAQPETLYCATAMVWLGLSTSPPVKRFPTGCVTRAAGYPLSASLPVKGFL